jgi:hypothetical protein
MALLYAPEALAPSPYAIAPRAAATVYADTLRNVESSEGAPIAIAYLELLFTRALLPIAIANGELLLTIELTPNASEPIESTVVFVPIAIAELEFAVLVSPMAIEAEPLEFVVVPIAIELSPDALPWAAAKDSLPFAVE